MRKIKGTIRLDEDISSFENDEYKFTKEMKKKYLESKIKMSEGQIRYDDNFFKNTSIFDLAGRKVIWGDIAPEDVDEMKGVYYLLSEYKSFWDFRNSKNKNPDALKVKYIKKNAIARIVDGKIETNDNLINLHFQ